MNVSRPIPRRDHGRPVVLELAAPEGKLRVHVDRDTGLLWLSVYGPQGGDRGSGHLNAHDAERVARWASDGWVRDLLSAHDVWVRAGVDTLTISTPGRSTRPLKLPATEEAVTALREVLGAWSRGAWERVDREMAGDDFDSIVDAAADMLLRLGGDEGALRHVLGVAAGSARMHYEHESVAPPSAEAELEDA